MITTNKENTDLKYKIIHNVATKIKKGELVLNEDEFKTYSALKKDMKYSYGKGLGLGILTSLIGVANYSYLMTRSKPVIAMVLLPAPIIFPFLWRLREEYRYQNQMIGLYGKYYSQIFNDFEEK